jgi:hypothetical protein
VADRILCPYCRLKHLPRHLCDPAKAVLDAMVARGDSFTMPTLTFDQPMYETPGPVDRLLAQLVVKGAVIPAPGGVQHPALVFTGRDMAGPLPQWLYSGNDAQLRAAARLVHEMTELAIRTADEQNGRRRG